MPSNVELFLRALGRHFRADQLLVNKQALSLYSFDASPYFGQPAAVFFPESTQEVANFLSMAAKFKVETLPRGAGTNLSGGTVPKRGQVIICLSRMRHILAIDWEREYAVVEPGVTNLELQRAVEAKGYMFAPDPGSMNVATIGGHVAENAGGMRCVKYGVTRDHILGLELVTAEGKIFRLGKLALLDGKYAINSRVNTANLVDLIVGSEGTLGVVTQVMVKLLKKPAAYKTLLCSFNDLRQAGDAVSGVIKAGIVPAAMEIIDQKLTRAIDDFVGLGLPRDTQALLLIELDGWEADLSVQMEHLMQILHANGVTRVDLATDSKEREQIWLARRSVNGALGRIKPYYMVQDVTVPRHKVATMIQKVEEIGKKYGVTIGLLAHAGDGNLHPHLLYSDRERELPQIEAAAEEIFQATVKLEGTLSGEHGIGIEKRPYLNLVFRPAELEFLQAVKDAFDPCRLLNLDKAI
ncbi:FAD-binding protein [Desulfallas sp. Bu1-1]|uniref:FAD-binding oxidoreductase n=1 Tax=Desulfallas sp. Bu1-1 TaxID=2787620 RepID=UPI00189EBA17|nr:FAD-linked oxidase C-terminal domain-containing protein [Desulfallas sp. Bu1-1]MBF7084065.1 FAD-binding protein [Desulfallas sp. Bu1-1]